MVILGNFSDVTHRVLRVNGAEPKRNCNISNVQYDEDAIIVLGAGIRGEQVTRILANRLNTAIEYHKKNPSAKIIVTGDQGQGRREFIPESLAMKRYLIAIGIPEEIIFEENKV